MSVTNIHTPIRIYLIRHGETEWALNRRLTGHTEVALTANGEAEAQEMELRLGDIPFSHVFTSPRQRARQTCRLAKLGKLAEVDPDLDEWNYGDYEGRRSADIRQQRPDWNLYRDGCPQGETPEQVAGRADRFIARLHNYQGNVALFSHGQFGSALAMRWLGMPLTVAVHFPLATASISIFAFNPQYPEVPVISLWNAVSPRPTIPPATLADAALRV